MRTTRPLPAPPEEIGVHEGLCFARFAPQRPWGSLLILHGADSGKESHFDFARAARARGLEALAVDLRGHGDSEGPLSEGVLDDLRALAALLPVRPLALRGSSMGGYLALVAARAVGASAVIAICPAPGEGLARGVTAGRFAFAAAPGLAGFFRSHDLETAVEQLELPLLLMHAEGDELIAPEHSAALHARAASPNKRLLVLPGGHHRSIQHDDELQGESLRFLEKAMPQPAR